MMMICQQWMVMVWSKCQSQFLFIRYLPLQWWSCCDKSYMRPLPMNHVCNVLWRQWEKEYATSKISVRFCRCSNQFINSDLVRRVVFVPKPMLCDDSSQFRVELIDWNECKTHVKGIKLWFFPLYGPWLSKFHLRYYAQSRKYISFNWIRRCKWK